MFSFVADFANIQVRAEPNARFLVSTPRTNTQDWDPGVKSSRRDTPDLGVGSSFSLVTLFKGDESSIK